MGAAIFTLTQASIYTTEAMPAVAEVLPEAVLAESLLAPQSIVVHVPP